MVTAATGILAYSLVLENIHIKSHKMHLLKVTQIRFHSDTIINS